MDLLGKGSGWRGPLIAALAVVAVFLAVRWASGGGPAQGSPGACSWSRPPASAVPDAEVVTVVDRSRSTPPGLGRALAGELEKAVGEGAVVSLGGFDGGVRTSWVLSRVQTAGDDVNDMRRELHRKRVIECLRQSVDGVAATPPAIQGSNPLAALSQAGKRLDPSVPHRTIVLATDGLANLGCADLRRLRDAIGDRGQLDPIVEGCRRSGELPRLAGVEVELVGIGLQGPGQPEPGSTAQLAWLEELWQRLCDATGATCSRSNETPPAGSPPRPARGARDPVVSFPQLEVATGPDGAKTITLAGSMLFFATDSAELSAGAAAVIRRAAEVIRDVPAALVTVAGYTDARGTEAHNQDLSKRRAARVGAALLAEGVHGVTAVGYGEARPRCVPQYHPDHSPDLGAMACNRRVVITARPGR